MRRTTYSRYTKPPSAICPYRDGVWGRYVVCLRPAVDRGMTTPWRSLSAYITFGCRPAAAAAGSDESLFLGCVFDAGRRRRRVQLSINPSVDQSPHLIDTV